ncbi:carboxypeptidase regulatory-like domain-containing protein [Aeoliella sp.]|uniref:carboxypeptidase regulatory-like domain-containing protein n=1 Tax=Aeoliella sp. TaxID=2795800 RepID=UPI003CCBA4BA
MLSDTFWLAETEGGWFACAAAVLVRITLLLALAWMGHRVLGRRSPYLRVFYWRAVVVGLVVVTSVTLLPYRMSLPLWPSSADTVPTATTPHGATEPAIIATTHEAPVEALPAPDAVLDDPIDWQAPMVKQSSTPVADPTLAVAPATPSTSTFGLSFWLAKLWIAGGAVSMVSWLLGNWRLRQLYRKAAPVPAEVESELRQLASWFGYPTTIAVRQTSDLSTAISFGVWRPRILMPTHQIIEGEPVEQRAMLAHEVAHAVGNDLVWNQLMVLVRAALWFHPLVWPMRLAHADACDEVCDARAAEFLGDSKLYGRVLARLALKLAGRQTSLGLAFARRSQVRKRVELVKENVTRQKPKQHRTALLLASVLGVSVVTGLATTERAPAQTPTAEAESAPVALTATTEPGAAVELYRYADWSAEPTLELETTADSKGIFTFDKLPARDKDTQLYVVVKKPGFAPKSSLIRDDHEGPMEIELHSEPVSLSGVITDNTGQPVVGVQVTTQYRKHPMPGLHIATTDQQGRFSIDDLSPWSVEETRTFDPKTGMGTMASAFRYYVTHPNYVRTHGEYTRIPQQVKLQLNPPAIIGGRVFDLVTGKPMAGVEVQAQGIGPGGWHTTTSDAEGEYELRLNGDHYNIWAVAPERMPLAIKAIHAAAGKRLIGQDIRMTRGGYVEGKVLDANKRPIDGTQTKLRVAHYGPARPKVGAAVTSTLVGDDGSYRLHVAPGRNYIYLMGGNASAYVEVGDGQTVQHDILQGSSDTLTPRMMDDDDRLAQQIREAARRAKQAKSPQQPQPDAATLRPDTPVNQLITVLDDMNQGSEQFTDLWANQLRTIAAFGEDAVPDLIAEVDRTDNDMMLRSTAFLLRAIDDKRAVPALIRAIPKTLRSPGSDMGLRIRGADESLLEFVQANDLDRRNSGSEYGFGRPVREVFGALQSLTGQKFGEQELYSIFLNDDDLPGQKRAKRLLYHRVAKQWAEWWNEHASEYTDDPAFQSVEIPTLPESTKKEVALAADTPLETASGSGNWILQSARRLRGQVFYDLDTGRATSLPKRWHDQQFTPEVLEQVTQWAGDAGYDLMGDELPSDSGEPVFVLRGIGLDCWELPKQRWKNAPSPTSIAQLQAEGRALDGDLLLHFDGDKEQPEPEAVATFFYQTREGTPGVLYVGIPVYDDSLKPGGVSEGDDELNPVAFNKGRRFGFSRLVVTENE